MAEEIGVGAGASDVPLPSAGASIAAAASAAAAIVGIAGQLAAGENVWAAMLAGFGLAVLAAIVLVHQR